MDNDFLPAVDCSRQFLDRCPERKKMNLAVLIDHLIPGGVQQAAIEEVKLLNKSGHKALLLILIENKKFQGLLKNVPHDFLFPNLPFHIKQSFKLPFFSFLTTSHLLSPIFLPKYFQTHRFDLIISHGSTTSLTALALNKKLNLPFIAIIHDPMLYILKKSYHATPLRYLFPLLKPLIKNLEKQIGASTQAILIDSNFHEKRIKKYYHQIPEILPLGSYPKKIIPKKRGNFILALSRWQKEKNPFLLNQFLLKLPQAKLIMAGSWINETDKKSFLESASQYKVRSRIKFISNLKDQDKQKLFSQSRCFVHPNEEAFGLAGLEAIAHGVPIIMPVKSGVASLFTHGIHGYFPKKASVKSFLPYLKRFINNERMAWKMGKSAWKKLKVKYTWNTHVKKLEKYITKMHAPSAKKSLLAIELGHLSSRALSGGDKLFSQILPFIKSDLKISILIPSLAKTHWKGQANRHIKLLVLDPEKFSLTNNFTYFLAYLNRIRLASNLLKNMSFDIILSTNNSFVDVIPAFLYKQKHPQTTWLARVHHLPQSISLRGGSLFTNLFSLILQRLTLKLIQLKADRVIALNPSVYSSLKKINIPASKLEIIGTGINLSYIHKHHSKKQYKFNVVTVGRLHPAKGTFDLPDIWFEVTKSLPNAKLAIIGEARPSILLNLKREFIKRNIEKQVEILGFVSAQKLFDVLKSSQLFLMTDREAGWSLASAEAMACGLPVVAYQNPIFGNVFKTGFVTAEIGNRHQFAHKIIKLLHDPQKLKSLRKKAIKQASLLDINNLQLKVRSLLLNKY
jgi:glycosyltransferase involved in cell wall biosynthesis